MSEICSCCSRSVQSSDTSFCEVNRGRRFRCANDFSAESSISSRIKWFCTGCEGLICESISSGPFQYVIPKVQNERKIAYSPPRAKPQFRNQVVHTPVENMLKAVEEMHRSLNTLEPKRNSKDASTSTKHDQKMSTVSVNTDKRQWFAVNENKVHSFVPDRPVEEKRTSLVSAETVRSFVPDTEKRFSIPNTEKMPPMVSNAEKRPLVDVEHRHSFESPNKERSPVKQDIIPQPPFSSSPPSGRTKEPVTFNEDPRRVSHVSTVFNAAAPIPTRPLFYHFTADSKTDIKTLIEKLEMAKMRLQQEEKQFEKEAAMAKTKRSFFKN